MLIFPTDAKAAALRSEASTCSDMTLMCSETTGKSKPKCPDVRDWRGDTKMITDRELGCSISFVIFLLASLPQWPITNLIQLYLYIPIAALALPA